MKRGLIVEGNEDNMCLMRVLPQKSGFAILEARDGAEGVELAVKKKPDLILMESISRYLMVTKQREGLKQTRRPRIFQ